MGKLKIEVTAPLPEKEIDHYLGVGSGYIVTPVSLVTSLVGVANET
jgi:hypothetical protein